MSDTVIVKSALSIGLEIRIVTGNGAEYALQLRGMNARGFEVRVTGLDPEKSLDNAIQQNQKKLCGRSRILGKGLQSMRPRKRVEEVNVLSLIHMHVSCLVLLCTAFQAGAKISMQGRKGRFVPRRNG